MNGSVMAGASGIRPRVTRSALVPARQARLAMVVGIVAIAFGLRAWAGWKLALIHADEMGQYLEPAARLVFGDGFAPWEFRYGMRSWLLPLVLAAPIAVVDHVAPGAGNYLFAVRMLLAGFALTTVFAARAIGQRFSPTHGWVAFAVVAFWWQIVWFAPHPLSEPIATALALAGYAYATRRPSTLTAACGGLALALTCLVRFQYAPAVAVIVAALLIGLPARARLALIGGGVLGLAISAIADLWAGMTPYAWMYRNFAQNINAGRASAFGVYPASAYLGDLAESWGAAAGLIVVLALVGARRLPALALAAIVNLAVHMAVGHKEFRFILLTLTILIVLAAIGSVDVMRLVRRVVGRGRQRRWTVGLVALWAGLCGYQVAADAHADRWRWSRDALADARRLGDDRGACGILIEAGQLWHYPRIVLHNPVPVYLYERVLPSAPAPTADAIARGVNRIVRTEPGAQVPIPAGFTRVSCRSRADELMTESKEARTRMMCTWARPGTCDATALRDWVAQRVLVRRDE